MQTLHHMLLFFLKYSKSSKTNLQNHFDRKHAQASPEEKARASGSQTLQLSLQPFRQQGEISYAVADAVIEGNQPVSPPELPWFRKLMSKACPGWKPCSRKTVRGKVIKKGHVQVRL